MGSTRRCCDELWWSFTLNRHTEHMIRYRSFLIQCCILILVACDGEPLAHGDAALLAAQISDLPVPADATQLQLSDNFVEPNGDIHNQGVIELRVQMDPHAFLNVWNRALETDYRKVSAYRGPYKHPSMETAPQGLFRFTGEMGANYSLVVLDSLRGQLNARLVRSSGLP
jgi:hypothetical protein